MVYILKKRTLFQNGKFIVVTSFNEKIIDILERNNDMEQIFGIDSDY